MPSYIELDKQSSFPAASNVGKVILGISSSGAICVTNSDGTTSNPTGGASLPYTEYVAKLTQASTDPPTTSIVLNNTMNLTPTWSYNDVGQYEFIIPASINTDKLISNLPYVRYNNKVGYDISNITQLIEPTPFFEFDDTVYTIATQSDGKILVGGVFTSYGIATCQLIARLNTDYTYDADFVIGTGFNSEVYTIVQQSDGKILVGGNFTTYNGTASSKIIRLDASGSIDPTFNIGTGIHGFVRAIAIQTDGKILVGGEFDSYNDTARPYLVRLDASGSLDTTFNTGTGFEWHPKETVNAIVIQPDGKILVGGEFSNYDGVDRSWNILRLNADGSVDAGFDGSGLDQRTNTLALQSDGKIIVGGNFNSRGMDAYNYIIRLNTDGSTDATFDTGTGFDGEVYTITIQSDGKIVVGGGFSTYNGGGSSYIVRLNSNGIVDDIWTHAPSPIIFNNPVRAITFRENGNILVGGQFTADILSNPYYFIAEIENYYKYTLYSEAGDDKLVNQPIEIKLYN